MKKIAAILGILLLIVSCNSQKKFHDYDISYARSGGLSPIYENLLIKGNHAFYSFEGNGKKTAKNITLTNEEIKEINGFLTQNRFTKIHEDAKKMFDNISININVKKGANTGSKTDASGILPQSQEDWANITKGFSDFIKAKALNP